jgi:hypothetical protein
MYRKKQTNLCEHPKHEEYLEAFLKKYPTANKDAHLAINMVDPEEWLVSDNAKKNTVSCCQMCSISEDIARAGYRNISTAKA